jgi:RNA polymerase sigma factor (sigma-70 family)
MTDADRSDRESDALGRPDGTTRADDSGEPSPWVQAADLFERWRVGETRAMDGLVRLMTPVLWHVVRAYGLERALAEDVVQTTWLTLVRRHESIADGRAVAGWLTMCARREAWRVSRAQRRADPTETDQLEAHLPAAQPAEQSAVLDDDQRVLWLAVARLDERCQRLLRVIAFEERPDYARIAHDLEMAVGSIGPTRRRCLVKLRGLLEGDGYERGVA